MDSIVVGRKWMAGIKQYIRAAKHPATPDTVWRNLFGLDIVRSRVKGRCDECDATISEDPIKVAEIYVQSEQKTKHVCDVCKSIHTSLYSNYKMKNQNYFKNIDEEEQRENENRKKGWK